MTVRKSDPRGLATESKGKVQIMERDSASSRAAGARHTIDVDPSWLEGLDSPPEALPAPPPLPFQGPAAKARAKVAPIPREEEASHEETDRVTPPLPPPIPARRSSQPPAQPPARPAAAAPAPRPPAAPPRAPAQAPRIAPPAPAAAAASAAGPKKPLVAPKKPLIAPRKAGAPAPAKPAPQKKEG